MAEKSSDNNTAAKCLTCGGRLVCYECAEIKKLLQSIEKQLSMIKNITFLDEPHLSPKNCFAIGEGRRVAFLNQRTTVVLTIVDQVHNPYTRQVDNLISSTLVHTSTGNVQACTIQRTRANENQYEISYQPTSLGEHQLHITVDGEHINGSPFNVTVIDNFNAPSTFISGVITPQGIAFNQKGEIVVVEYSVHRVSIFSPKGEKLRSFGTHGSNVGEFSLPCGVAVDDDDNILVADGRNDRIQKFTADGKFIASVGKYGSGNLEFTIPVGIGINPHNKRIYVTDSENHRIQILNPDLTFHKSFASQGYGDGELNRPKDLAFDSKGNVYVADNENHRVVVFTAEGEFLRSFGVHGKGDGEINFSTGVGIDSNDIVYVTDLYNSRVLKFTTEGKFLTSLFTRGSGENQLTQPRGIAVGKNGTIYVSDFGNDRIQKVSSGN